MGALAVANVSPLRAEAASSEKPPQKLAARRVPPDPLFILAPPRSFTSVVGAMIGQHPQMYGLPEMHFFGYETVSDYWQACLLANYTMKDGALRAVAQLVFGGQSETTVKLARGWLRRRYHLTTGALLEQLAQRVHPKIFVEKSPNSLNRREPMSRMYEMFPEARFIHLVRHPRGHAESIMKFIGQRRKLGPIPRSHWLIYLSTYPHTNDGQGRKVRPKLDLDPQFGWYAVNANIHDFLKSIPEAQKLTLRGEEMLTDPDRTLREVCLWLGLRADNEAIEEMKHPERSPYACIGPAGARYGNDTFFLRNPVLRPAQAQEHSLKGPLSWRQDGREFAPRVKELARQFGYQ